MGWNRILMTCVVAAACTAASRAEAQVSVGFGGVAVGIGSADYAPPTVSVYRAPMVGFGVAPVAAYHPASGPAPFGPMAVYGPVGHAGVGYRPSVAVTVARPVVVPAPVMIVGRRYRFGQPVRNAVRRAAW